MLTALVSPKVTLNRDSSAIPPSSQGVSPVTASSGTGTAPVAGTDATGSESHTSSPVAKEVAVTVAGARSADSTGQREIFSETTSTALLFADGAVIRLSAQVDTRQLLFLTNKQSGKEVVAQVLLKRSLSPTSWYVDVQFTEPFPDFWGIEFPAAANAPTVSAATAFQQAKILSETPGNMAGPGVEEDEKLRQEIATLHGHLQSVVRADGSNHPVQTLADQVAGGVVPAPTEGKHTAVHDEPETLPTSALNFGQVNVGMRRSAAQKIKRAKSRGSMTTYKMRLGLLTGMLVVTAAIGAWYKQWLPAALRAKLPSPTAVPMLPQSAATGLLPKQALAKVVAYGSSESTDAKSSGAFSDALPEIVRGAVGGEQAKTGRSNVEEAVSRKLSPRSEREVSSRELNAGTERGREIGNFATQSTDSSSAGGAYTPPKLLESARAISPPQAIRSYISGNVDVDALVDAEGRVESARALDGPKVLQDVAIQTVKRYKYAPATRGGKPVPAHVEVKVQFWYEP
jgi:TonB family protein